MRSERAAARQISVINVGRSSQWLLKSLMQLSGKISDSCISCGSTPDVEVLMLGFATRELEKWMIIGEKL